MATTPQEERQHLYYEEQYNRLCNGDIPKKVWEEHKRAMIFMNRTGGNDLSPQLMVTVCLLAGVPAQTAKEKRESKKVDSRGNGPNIPDAPPPKE